MLPCTFKLMQGRKYLDPELGGHRGFEGSIIHLLSCFQQLNGIMAYGVTQRCRAVCSGLVNYLRYLANVFRHRPGVQHTGEVLKRRLVALNAAKTIDVHGTAGEISFVTTRLYQFLTNTQDRKSTRL